MTAQGVTGGHSPRGAGARAGGDGSVRGWGNKSLHPVLKLRCPAKLCPQLCVPRVCGGVPARLCQPHSSSSPPEPKGGSAPLLGGPSPIPGGSPSPDLRGGVPAPFPCMVGAVDTSPPHRHQNPARGPQGPPPRQGCGFYQTPENPHQMGGVEFYPPQGKTLLGFPSRHPQQHPFTASLGGQGPPKSSTSGPPTASQTHRDTSCPPTHPASSFSFIN